MEPARLAASFVRQGEEISKYFTYQRIYTGKDGYHQPSVVGKGKRKKEKRFLSEVAAHPNA